MSLTNLASSLRGQCVEHTDCAYPPLVMSTTSFTIARRLNTPQTQECTCAAPLNDHVAIVSPHRIPTALPHNAGGVQSNAATPSNAVVVSSPNIANLRPSLPPLAPSPHQLYSSEPIIQADIPGHYPDTIDGFYIDREWASIRSL